MTFSMVRECEPGEMVQVSSEEFRILRAMREPVWRPTMELRWLYRDGGLLQQKWVSDSGENEWRGLPVEKAE